jgi:mRNA interferase MazF
VRVKVQKWGNSLLIPDLLEVSGVILSDQVKIFDWRARKAKYICTLPEKYLNEVLGKLGVLL